MGLGSYLERSLLLGTMLCPAHPGLSSPHSPSQREPTAFPMLSGCGGTWPAPGRVAGGSCIAGWVGTIGAWCLVSRGGEVTLIVGRRGLVWSAGPGLAPPSSQPKECFVVLHEAGLTSLTPKDTAPWARRWLLGLPPWRQGASAAGGGRSYRAQAASHSWRSNLLGLLCSVIRH